MRQLVALLLALVFIVSSAFSQNSTVNHNPSPKKARTEIMNYLAKMSDVSVTYLTRSMLQRLTKDKTESPLAMLVDKGGVESVRVIQLGSNEAETEGKKLIDSYLSDISEMNYAELLMSQNNSTNEVIIYGFPIFNDTFFYHTVLMYSKSTGKRAILIILKGKIPENTIGDLIDSF